MTWSIKFYYLAHENQVGELLLVEHLVLFLLDVPVRRREIITECKCGGVCAT